MRAELNAFEVLQIAEQIERNAVRFYRKAAELFVEQSAHKMFLELADWEAKHEEVFAEMRKRLSEEMPEQQISISEDILYKPKAMAGLAVFGIRPDPGNELSGMENITDILKTAIEKEKDSIVYYIGLKDFVSDRFDKDKIDDIIKEEMKHINILRESLEQKEYFDVLPL